MPRCTKRAQWRHGLTRMECKKPSGLWRASSSTPRERWLLPRPPRSSLEPDLANACLAEWTNPYIHTPKSSGKRSQTFGGYYNSKGGLDLEWDVEQTHASVMVSCLKRFRFPHAVKYILLVLTNCCDIIGIKPDHENDLFFFSVCPQIAMTGAAGAAASS